MSENFKRQDVVIHSITRKNNSASGNPTFDLHTSEGTYRTETDASLGYGIENLTNSRHTDTFVIGNPSNPVVTLLLTGRRVSYIERDGVRL